MDVWRYLPKIFGYLHFRFAFPLYSYSPTLKFKQLDMSQEIKSCQIFHSAKKEELVEKMEMEKVEDVGKSELVLVLVCHCIAMYTAGPGLQILTRLSRLFRSCNATIMDHIHPHNIWPF